MRPPISPLPFLTQIPDWRASTRIQYPWDALWTVILTGLLAGPPNILALTQWLAGHREVLCQHLGLDRLPQQAMIYRFFWSLDQHLPELQRALLDWVKAQHPTAHDRLVILAGDGKVLKGSAREGRSALSFLSVFFHELALTVAQVDQAGRHEAKGMQDLLPTLTTLFGDGWLMTLDAAYTERELTTRIDEAGGAYLVPLKNNTRSLKEWAKFAFTYPAHDHVVDVERRSGEVWDGGRR
ncbi:ISAs1 family transposase [Deinococcus sp.]|uniref:ISAs1 family transposase n=1 Tax=Deinococcus sp. TaxID=47478 RepID=UPI00391CBE3D